MQWRPGNTMSRQPTSSTPPCSARSVLSGRPISVAWNDAPDGFEREPANDADSTVQALGRRVANEGPLPPEQVVPMIRQAAAALAADLAAGRYLDTRSQVYWLGGVMFFALTGKTPFQSMFASGGTGRTAAASEPPAPSAHSPHLIHPLLDAIVRTCLATSRSARFASAFELEAALGSVPLFRRTPDTNSVAPPGASVAPEPVIGFVDDDSEPPTERESGIRWVDAESPAGEMRHTG